MWRIWCAFVLLAMATFVHLSTSGAEVSAQIKSSVRPYLLLTLNDTLSPSHCRQCAGVPRHCGRSISMTASKLAKLFCSLRFHMRERWAKRQHLLTVYKRTPRIENTLLIRTQTFLHLKIRTLNFRALGRKKKWKDLPPKRD